MQGWLKPHVCDCAQSADNAQAGDEALACAELQEERAEPDADHAMASCVEAGSGALDEAIARASQVEEEEELIEGIDEEAPRLRTLSRERRAAEKEKGGEPLELFDPTIAGAKVDDAEFAQKNFNVSLEKSDDALVFHGEFAQVPGEELAVVRPGQEIAVYGESSRIARVDFKGELAPQAFVELGLKLNPEGASAVRLVKDGTLQLLAHWREADDEGKFSYRVGVFKVTGPFIANVFTKTLATSDAPDGELQRQGTYEILRGEEHRAIRWIPADESGKLLVDQAETLEWNRWEGMYRVPAPPAAGPKRDKLHAQWYGNQAAFYYSRL